MDSDFDLLDAWRAGDERSGNDLFERHFDSVFRFFRYKMPEQAEDLTQQTMLACVKAQPSFRKEASFRTYIFRVAKSKLYDALARQHQNAAADFSVSSVADFGQSPSSALAGSQERSLLVQALRQLPVDLQVIVELRYVEHMRGPEIARVLELPEGTVRSRLRRAVARLKVLAGAVAQGDAQLPETLTRIEQWADEVKEMAGPASGDTDGG